MNGIVQMGLTNALAAAALAVIAAVAGKLCRRPALRHALWLLVLVKLVTPPLVVIPVAFPEVTNEAPAPPVAQAAQQPPEQVADAAAALQDKSGERQAAKLENGAVLPVGAVDHLEPVALARLPVALLTDTGPDPPIPGDGAHELERAFPLSDLPWITLLGSVWLVGSIAWFTLALLRVRRFQRVLRTGQAGSMALQHEASMLAMRMGLRDCPGVCFVPGVVSPLLWAVAGYPRLLLPADLYSKLDPLQRQTLLAHELAHYRRRDHWVRCLEFLALGLYWWFPVVWWARRELREAEEECCDAWVLWTLPQAAKAYASALVETLDFLSNSQMALPPAASGLGQLDLLRRRLTMIMRGTMPRNLSGLGFLAVLGLGVLLLPLVPSWAQQDLKNPGPGLVPPGDQPPKDLQKAKEELDRAFKELQQFKAHLDQMHVDFDLKTKLLEEAQARLKDAVKTQEMAKKVGGGFGGGGKGGGGAGFGGQGGKSGGGGAGGFGFNPGPPNPAVDKRLSELEKKLDMVLDELQEMRKTIGKGPPGDEPFKGGKKGGGKGKGGFGGGGPGGGGKGGPGRPFIPPGDVDREASFEDSPAVLTRDLLPGEIAAKKRQ